MSEKSDIKYDTKSIYTLGEILQSKELVNIKEVLVMKQVKR